MGIIRRMPVYWRYSCSQMRRLWNTYPEHYFAYTFCGTATFLATINLIYRYGLFPDEKPFYRSHYDVVRSDSEIALNWRLPEEYPAYYLTNRENERSATFDRDYGWKSAKEGKI